MVSLQAPQKKEPEFVLSTRGLKESCCEGLMSEIEFVLSSSEPMQNGDSLTSPEQEEGRGG